MLNHENIFEINSKDEETIEKGKDTLIKIENRNENELLNVANMHMSSLPVLFKKYISLVPDSQNLHEAARIYKYLAFSSDEEIVKNAKKGLKELKTSIKYSTKLDDEYYYLKVGKNYVYTFDGKIFEIYLKDFDDYKEFKKTLKGIENGKAISEYNMAVMLEEVDMNEAIKYYEKSAIKGDVDAQYNLGCIMLSAKKIDEAIKFFKMAANQNDKFAKIKLLNIQRNKDENLI